MFKGMVAFNSPASLHSALISKGYETSVLSMILMKPRREPFRIEFLIRWKESRMNINVRYSPCKEAK